MGVRSLVGPIPLALAIVGASRLLLNGVRAQAAGRDEASATFHGVLAVLTIPVFGVLLFLWSIAIDVSLASSVLAWSAILASGYGCVRLASKWRHKRAKPTDSLRLAA
jgi:hypothetical protein